MVTASSSYWKSWHLDESDLPEVWLWSLSDSFTIPNLNYKYLIIGILHSQSIHFDEADTGILYNARPSQILRYKNQSLYYVGAKQDTFIRASYTNFGATFAPQCAQGSFQS